MSFYLGKGWRDNFTLKRNTTVFARTLQRYVNSNTIPLTPLTGRFVCKNSNIIPLTPLTGRFVCKNSNTIPLTPLTSRFVEKKMYDGLRDNGMDEIDAIKEILDNKFNIWSKDTQLYIVMNGLYPKDTRDSQHYNIFTHINNYTETDYTIYSDISFDMESCKYSKLTLERSDLVACCLKWLSYRDFNLVRCVCSGLRVTTSGMVCYWPSTRLKMSVAKSIGMQYFLTRCTTCAIKSFDVDRYEKPVDYSYILSQPHGNLINLKIGGCMMSQVLWWNKEMFALLNKNICKYAKKVIIDLRIYHDGINDVIISRLIDFESLRFPKADIITITDSAYDFGKHSSYLFDQECKITMDNCTTNVQFIGVNVGAASMVKLGEYVTFLHLRRVQAIFDTQYNLFDTAIDKLKRLKYLYLWKLQDSKCITGSIGSNVCAIMELLMKLAINLPCLTLIKIKKCRIRSSDGISKFIKITENICNTDNINVFCDDISVHSDDSGTKEEWKKLFDAIDMCVGGVLFRGAFEFRIIETRNKLFKLMQDLHGEGNYPFKINLDSHNIISRRGVSHTELEGVEGISMRYKDDPENVDFNICGGNREYIEAMHDNCLVCIYEANKNAFVRGCVDFVRGSVSDHPDLVRMIMREEIYKNKY